MHAVPSGNPESGHFHCGPRLTHSPRARPPETQALARRLSLCGRRPVAYRLDALHPGSSHDSLHPGSSHDSLAGSSSHSSNSQPFSFTLSCRLNARNLHFSSHTRYSFPSYSKIPILSMLVCRPRSFSSVYRLFYLFHAHFRPFLSLRSLRRSHRRWRRRLERAGQRASALFAPRSAAILAE